jgi:hypothetical protein
MLASLARNVLGITRTKVAPHRYSIILILSILMCAMILAPPRLFDVLFSPDESMLLVYPERILAGQWPNRDFFNAAYGPGQFWILAAVYKVFGPSVIIERLVGWVLHVAIAFGVVRITWSRGRFVAGVAGCVSLFVLAFVGLGAYAWLSALSLAIWSIGVLAGRRNERTFVVAGLMVGTVWAIRPDLGPAAVACQLPLLWGSHFKRFWMLGFSFGAIPMMVHLLVAGTQFVQNFFLVIRASRAGLMVPPYIPTSLRLAAVLLVLSVMGLVWSAVRERDSVLGAVAVLSSLLLPQAFQRTDVIHLAFVGCFIWPMWLAIAFSKSALAVGVVHRYGARFVRLFVSVTAVLFLGVILITDGSSWEKTKWITHLDRSMPIHDAASTISDPVSLDKTNALIVATNERVRKGGRIFIGAVNMRVQNYSPMYLYFLLPEYRPAGYYLEFPGDFEDVGSAISHDIVHADALLLSDTPELQRGMFRGRPDGSSEANDAVARYFCPVGRYGFVWLYVRCRS